LKEMIARITPENIPPMFDWGLDVGAEVIPPEENLSR